MNNSISKINKIVLIVMIFTLLSSSVQFIFIISVSAAGETSADPVPIIEGITSGYLDQDASIWYSINLNGTYLFTLKGNKGTDFNVYIYNSSFGSYGELTNSYYPDVLKKLENFGLFYIRVISIVGFGDFSLNITKVDRIQGDSASNPLEIIEGETKQYLSFGDTIWYSFNLSGSYLITLNASTENTDFDAYLYEEDFSEIGAMDQWYYPEKLKVIDVLGVYYLRVFSYKGSGEFILNITSYPRIDGDSVNNPIQLNISNTNSSKILGDLPGPSVDFSTWYNVTLEGNYNLSLSSYGSTDFNMRVYNQTIYLIDHLKSRNNPEYKILDYTSGIYYFEVYSKYHTGNFSIEILSLPIMKGESVIVPIIIEKEIINEQIKGYLPFSNIDGDIWYRMNLTGDYLFNLTADETTDYDLNIYDEDINLLDSSSKSSYPEEVKIFRLNGTYYINIERYTGKGNFTFDIVKLNNAGISYSNSIIMHYGKTFGILPGPASDGSIWYKIKFRGTYLFSSNNMKISLTVFGSNMNFINSLELSDSPQKVELVGIYYLKVFSSEIGEFILVIEELEIVMGYSMEYAIPIKVGTVNNSLPGPSLDGAIWYMINMDGTYKISLSGSQVMYIDIKVFSKTGYLITETTSIDNPKYINLEEYYDLFYLKIISTIYSSHFTLKIEKLYIQTSVENTENNIPVIIIFTGIVLIGVIVYKLKKFAFNKTKLTKFLKPLKNNRFPSGKQICPACGTSFEKYALFCFECGTKI